MNLICHFTSHLIQSAMALPIFDSDGFKQAFMSQKKEDESHDETMQAQMQEHEKLEAHRLEMHSSTFYDLWS